MLKYFVIALLCAATLQIDVIVPYYNDPVATNSTCTDANLQTLVDSGLGARLTVVLSPQGGARITDQNRLNSYEVCIAFLQSSGIQVLGLVKTKVGDYDYPAYRKEVDVLSDINIWFEYYPALDGIYFDDVSNLWLQPYDQSREYVVGTYTSYLNYVNANGRTGKRAILNSKTALFPELIQNKGPLVGAVFFDDHYYWWAPDEGCSSLLWTNLQGSFDFGPWCQYVPNWDDVEELRDAIGDTITPQQLGAFINNAPSAEVIADAVAEAEENSIGFIYITDKGDYTELPSADVWAALLAAVTPSN